MLFLGRHQQVPSSNPPLRLAQALLKFLDGKLAGPEGARVPLSPEAQAVLLRVLTQAAPLLPPDSAADVERLTALAQAGQAGGAPMAATAAQPPPGGFPPDIEGEANANFQQASVLPLCLGGRRPHASWLPGRVSTEADNALHARCTPGRRRQRRCWRACSR